MPMLPLTLKQFNLISRTIQSVLDQIPEFRTTRYSCIAFACVGSYLAKKHFGLQGRVLAGAFCVRLAPDDVLGFVDNTSDTLSSEDGFHMWIQTNTHVIDFISPLYREIYADKGENLDKPRRALVLPLSKDAPSMKDFEQEGPFISFPDAEMSDLYIDRFIDVPSNRDLINICDTWISNLKRNGNAQLAIKDTKTGLINLSLKGKSASGLWR